MSEQDNIREYGLFQSRTPDYNIGEEPTPRLGAYEYGLGADDSSGTIAAQDSSFLLPQRGNVTNAQPQPSFWQSLSTPLVKDNPASNPLALALSGLANIVPSARPTIAANQEMFAQVYAQRRQEQAMAMQKKMAEREAAMQGLQALSQAGKIPRGALRNTYLQTLKKNYQALTGSDDTTLIDLYAKADDEETAAYTESLQRFFNDNPEYGIKEVGQLAQRPELLEKILSSAGTLLKARQEAKQDERIQQTLNQTLGTPETAPQVPAQSMSGQPAQPPQKVAPGKGYDLSEEQKAIQIKIMDAAKRHGLDAQATEALLGIAYQETRYQNIDNSRRDPKDGIGIFQFTPGTGAKYGIPAKPRQSDGSPAPDDPRFNVDANIESGVKLFKDNLRRYGSIDKAISAHNGDFSGRYLNLVRGHIPRLTGAPQGTQTSARTQARATEEGATAAEQTQLTQLTDRIANLDRAIDGLTPSAGASPKIEKTIDELRKTRKTLDEERKRIEDTYEKNKPDAATQKAARKLFGDVPWNRLTKTQRDAAIQSAPHLEAEDEAIKAAKVSEVTEKSRIRTAEATNQARFVPNPTEFVGPDGQPMSVGTTQEEAKRQNEEYKRETGKPYWKKAVRLAGEERDRVVTRAHIIDNMSKLVQGYGTLQTGPIAGRLAAYKQMLGVDVKSDEVAQRLTLDKISNDIAAARGGKALTPIELERIQRELPNANDPPEVFRTKLNTALTLTAELHKLHMDGLEEEGYTGLRAYQRGPVPQAAAPSAAGKAPASTTASPGTAAPKPNPLSKWSR